MASSSSSLKRKKCYDVFLSFRGTDVRNNFLSHLYTALDQNGLFTYIDSEELRKGEQISLALMNAIEESHVAIIVFSEDYASSPWCLEEVAKIMECKARKDLIVLPVFYKVEPREVRTGREGYGRAMAEHESKFGKDSKKVKRWKEALFDAGSLSGWDLNDGDEAKLIKRIVEEISLQLDRTPLHVAKQPVGIHLRVEKLKSMLNLESSDDILMIGLWGRGGIGKTTLAKALYNDIFRQFEGLCFLENVREASRDSKDLISLQEKLLSDILVGKRLAVTSIAGGINLMQYRLCRKKVLLVLDDVTDIEQLNVLAGDCEWFGKGSRIIITTRDSHLLTAHGIDEDHIYKVQTLEYCEAFELFNKHTFVRNNKIVIPGDLVDSALGYASGLPLALTVLGSFLCGRREHEWKSALDKLAKSPDKTINDVLKLSYDGLDDCQKEIFLDIACFFKGRSIEYIRTVLDSCDFNTTIEVQVLINKSLITEVYGELRMHDLIQLMGMDIVRQECRDEPSRRSRLWLCDDVRDALSGDLGIDKVRAIVLHLSEPEEIYIGPDAFTNLRRLRVLIMINVHNSFQGPICLPNGLRWFEWPECPWIPKFSSGSKKLVGLYMQRSNIQVVRDQFKDFTKLKFINFSFCQSLVCIPDLYWTPNLEKLNLQGCTNLERVHESVAYHGKLQMLNLSWCSKLQSFPDIPDKNKGLRQLYLEGTSIEELPASIENLVSLEIMDLNNCKNMTILPSSIYRLPNLSCIYLRGCSKLINFPKEEENSSDPHTEMGFPKLQYLGLRECNLSEVEFLENHSCFPSLNYLLLSENKFTNFPTCEHLYNLKSLDVGFCKQLQEILMDLGKLQHLSASGCKSLSKIPSDIWDIDKIDLSSCYELVRDGFNSHRLFKLERFCITSKLNVLLPGGEMPEWLVPNNEGHISFMVSKDLFEKLIGLVICVVFRGKNRQWIPLEFKQFANGTCCGGLSRFFLADLDHVLLESFVPWLEEDHFGPNGWCHFQCLVRVSRRGIVKKCGFRLICKPLENDLEVLRQDNLLLDRALLHEFRQDDNQTSTMEESSNEREDLLDSKTTTEENSSSNLVLKGSKMADFSLQKYRYSQICSCYRNVRPGGEMPEEFVLVEDGTICFTASQDLYEKFLGLALCVVFSVEDGKKEVSFNIVPHINDERRNVLSGTLGSFDSNHMWIQYLKSNVLWGLLEGAVDFGQFDERYLRFSLRLELSGGTMKKLGYVIRCTQLEDDLKAVLEDKQLVNSASLCEDSDHPSDSHIDEFALPNWVGHSKSEYLRRCHMHIEDLEASDRTDQTGSGE